MSICFVLWCIIWIYCALISLCITKPPPKIPLVTFPDPSLLISKLSSLGGLRLHLPQKPSVPGPMGAILNWAEGKITSMETETLDSLAGNILMDGNVVNMPPPGTTSKQIDVDGTEFMQALARGDERAANAAVGGPTNIKATVIRILKKSGNPAWQDWIEPQSGGYKPKAQICFEDFIDQYAMGEDEQKEPETDLPVGCAGNTTNPIKIGVMFTNCGVFDPHNIVSPFS